MPSSRTDLSCIGGLRERISKKFLSIHYKFSLKTAPDKSEKKKNTFKWMYFHIAVQFTNVQIYVFRP